MRSLPGSPRRSRWPQERRQPGWVKDSWSLLATPITLYDAAGAGMVGPTRRGGNGWSRRGGGGDSDAAGLQPPGSRDLTAGVQAVAGWSWVSWQMAAVR